MHIDGYTMTHSQNVFMQIYVITFIILLCFPYFALSMYLRFFFFFHNTLITHYNIYITFYSSISNDNIRKQ